MKSEIVPNAVQINSFTTGSKLLSILAIEMEMPDAGHKQYLLPRADTGYGRGPRHTKLGCSTISLKRSNSVFDIGDESSEIANTKSPQRTASVANGKYPACRMWSAQSTPLTANGVLHSWE